MSWDGYVDSLIDSSKGSITAGTIIGLDGGAIWTPAVSTSISSLIPALVEDENVLSRGGGGTERV